MSVATLLTHACTVQRQTKTNTDGVLSGPFNDTFALGVSCLVQEQRGQIEAADGGKSLNYDAIGFFLPTQDLRPRGQDDVADRIAMTAPASMVGITFMILSVADDSGQEEMLTAFLRRLASGS